MALSSLINSVNIKKYLDLWLNEDTPILDLNSFTANSEDVCASIEMKGKCILAGFPFVEAIFNDYNCTVSWKYLEGSSIDNKSIVAEVRGPHCKLLKAERTALNILSRACGIATIAKRVITKVSTKWNGQVSSSPNISPGMKMVERYAMLVGGMVSESYDSSSFVILNENNIQLMGNIANAVQAIKDQFGCLVMVEAKCSTKQEAIDAAAARVNVIMLENLKATEVRIISKDIKDANASVLVGVSGGIAENNIVDYAVPNVDIISSNIFSQGYRCIDVGFNIVSENNSSKSQKSESLNVILVPNESEKINTIFNKTDDSIGAAVETNGAHKVVLKRKLDELPIESADNKTDTKTIQNSKKDNKNIDEKSAAVATKVSKVESVPGTRGKAATVVIGRTGPTNDVHKTASTQARPAKAHSGRVYNMKSLGSARMPGHPVGARSIVSARDRKGVQSHMIRSMAAGLALTLHTVPRPNDAFFRGSDIGPTLRFGGSLHNLSASRMVPMYSPSTHNLKNFCKSCNVQNPVPGPPICRVCRKMLM